MTSLTSDLQRGEGGEEGQARDKDRQAGDQVSRHVQMSQPFQPCQRLDVLDLVALEIQAFQTCVELGTGVKGQGLGVRG